MTSKVLWGEGLLLRPQHFQRQDQYHEHRLHRSIRAVHPYAWGVERLLVDREALGNNVLRILELWLRFQDGELYEAPEVDNLPANIDLSLLPQPLQRVTYFAALPALKPHGSNCAEPGEDNTARFARAARETQDLFTRAAPVQMSCLKKSVRLVAESEPRDSYTCFPLLRLRRATSGGWELDETFIAPSLSLAAAPALLLQLRRLLEALQAKISALNGHQREPSRNVIEVRSADTSSFWLLHTASSAYASLTHYIHHPDLHPDRLFVHLLDVAGGLMTFSKSWTLADLPIYQHADPAQGFGKLCQIIRELLDTVISAKYLAIALKEVRRSYYQGALDSGKIDDKTAFYIAVSADMPALELVDAVPRRFKVGAPDDVEKCVLSALPGVPLQHAPQVPSAVPVQPDTTYFLLEPKGQLYQRMLQAQSMSIYVPSGLKDLRLQLLAVVS